MWKQSFAALALLYTICCVAALPGERSAEDILAAVDSIRAPGPNFTFDLTIESRPKGKEPVTQKMSVAVKDLKKTRVKFTDPPENRGRVLLMAGQDLWIYIPSTNQPIRISPQQRLLGQVANGDVARVVYSYDYKASLAGDETLGQDSCKVLDLMARTPEATYGKIRIWVGAGNDRPMKAEFYASTGKLLKTGVYEDYQRVLGKDRPMRVVITDAIRTGDVSTLQMSKLRIAEFPESDFDKDSLKFAR